MGKVIIGVFLTLMFLSVHTALAITDPASVPNNKFGIHIIEEHGLENAAILVNSSGGDWGYVTLVIREDERDIARWQSVFDTIRRLHLIPIVRIATVQMDGHWKKPVIDEIDAWMHFLNSLNWVVKNRYIVVGNEPNHIGEWQGEKSPEEYAKYLSAFYEKAKEGSDDYFILHAGMDASAPDDESHMDEELFIKQAAYAVPEYLYSFDGWASHSYPNPGFAGSPSDTGRGSVRTYEWEMDLLKRVGLEAKLPVFITETGWALYDQSEDNRIGENLAKALTDVWIDENIIAVTPFVLNYQGPPFNVFSWLKEDGTFYTFYDTYKSLPKISGIPLQENSAEVKFVVVPQVLDLSSTNDRIGIAYIKNTGQKIWEKDKSSYIAGKEKDLEITTPILDDIEPGHAGLAYFREIIVESVFANLIWFSNLL